MTRSWKSDLKLVIATALLLAVEVIWLLMHLAVIPNPFQKNQNASELKSAGFVMRSQKELRKRSLNSLVWENSGSDDPIYYYDSILTLSQSTATLHLNEQTEINLSENTLVTIEPPVSQQDKQIRLKFTRGDLRARNPYLPAKIQGQEWSLNLTQGSEVTLRQTGNDDFEVEVLKGNLEFEKDSEKKTLAENQVLKIEDNQSTETLSVAEGLKFEGPAYQRFYTFQAQTAVPVAWTGSAEQIQISPVGEEMVLKPLSPDQTTEQLSLTPGKYTLRLVQQGKVSEAREIEIWQAPSLHLLSPFPRDRVRTDQDITFIWTQIPEAKEYKFVLTDSQTNQHIEKRVPANTLDFTFSEESDSNWKVIGVDRDGYEMIAPYTNPIYPRKDPFAAPKLKSPELRAPASKKKPDASLSFEKGNSKWALLWKLALPKASAQSRSSADYEAVFAWEAVEGADLYTIEISSSADFRTPLVSKAIRKTEFIWTKFNLGTYYWRVAAGSSDGRMGVFSEPAKVQLQKLPENSADSDGVLVRKKQTAKSATPPTPPASAGNDELFKDLPKAKLDEEQFAEKVNLVTSEQRELRDTYLFEWTPLYVQWQLNGEDQLKAKLTGSTNGAGHFQTEQIYSDDRSYLVDFNYSQFQWKASDPNIYPFQRDQTMVDARAMVLLGDSKSGLLRGAIFQTVPVIERNDLEDIDISTTMALGPAVYYFRSHSERLKSGHSLGVMAGSQVFAFTTQNKMRYQFYKTEMMAVSLGAGLQVDFIFHKRSFSHGFGAGLSLGFEH